MRWRSYSIEEGLGQFDQATRLHELKELTSYLMHQRVFTFHQRLTFGGPGDGLGLLKNPVKSG